MTTNPDEKYLEEFGFKFSDESNFIQRYDYDVKDWLRTTLDKARQEAYEKGYNAGLADGTGKPMLAIEQAR